MYILNNPFRTLQACRDLVPLLDVILIEMDVTAFDKINIDVYIGENYRTYIIWESGTSPINKKVRNLKRSEIKNNFSSDYSDTSNCALFNLKYNFKSYIFSPDLSDTIKKQPSKFIKYGTIVNKIQKITSHHKYGAIFFNFEALEVVESNILAALKTKFKILEC